MLIEEFYATSMSVKHKSEFELYNATFAPIISSIF